MVRKHIISIILFAQGFCLFATPQVPDILLYNGEEYRFVWYSYPMETYFNKFPEKRPQSWHTGLWRGYVATFEIIQNELWVIDIKKFELEITDGRYTSRYVSIIRECLDGNDRMKIDWYNGLLVILRGEYYTMIEVQNGNFINESTMDTVQFAEFIRRQLENSKEFIPTIKTEN